MMQPLSQSSSPESALATSTRVPLRKKERKVKIVIDSGAFSAWRLDKTVNLDQYCIWLQNNSRWIAHYVNLDVILPGDPETAAAASFDNLVAMRERGLDPVPVFHVGEDVRWLDKMLDLGCEYIGLSATSLVSKGSIDDWYRLAWSRIVDVHGNPLVKVHAFGDSRITALSEFPWQSADSSTWLNGQKHGQVYLPGAKRMTHRQKVDHSRGVPDIQYLEGLDLARFDARLEELGLAKSAFDSRDGKASMLARSYLAAAYFTDLQRKVREVSPIAFKPQRKLVVNGTTREFERGPGMQIRDFSLMLATGTNNTTLPGLFAAKCSNLLTSYFYVTPRLTRCLEQYTIDPMSVITQPPYDKYFNILNEIIKEPGTNA